jgi:serine/threonine protein kinase
MAEESHHDPDERDTYVSNYSVFTSDTERIDFPSLPDKYHHNFISFVALAHQLEIDFMDVTWQPALHLLGAGGSSQIHASNLVTKQLTFAFKSSIPRRGRLQLSQMGADRQRFRSLVSEVLVLRHPEVRNHPNITKLLGVSWDVRNNSVWPVLLFPKADEGSLEDFIHGSKGTNASLEELIRICADVALGLDTLHGNSTFLVGSIEWVVLIVMT